MNRLIKKISCVVGVIFTLSMVMPSFCLSAKTADKTLSVQGHLYEFDEKSKYEIDSSSSDKMTDSSGIHMGGLSVTGNFTDTKTTDGTFSFVVADNELFSITYKYDNKLLNSSEDEWHLIDDSKKSVNGIELEDKIGKGAIILQTSLDKEKWVTTSTDTNIQENKVYNEENCINDIQLINGCYYRVIVAYTVERKLNSKKFLFIDTSDHETKKCAEVYEFYANYKNSGYSLDDDIETHNLGQVVDTGTDNGFSNSNAIDGDNPHFGWNIGQFVIGGFTKNIGDDTFLKNVGDKITLWFKLSEKDITALNGNKNLSINEDTNGYDQKFGVQKQNFKHGTLIIRFTDDKGKKHDPIVYTDFLEALSSPQADTKIQLFEEGDYDVSLDYEIKDNKFIDKLYNYKIAFSFKIRNSNCVVYPKDIKTGRYLANDSVTENGFVLDWAKSRYLNINVKLSQWTKGANGYTEDTIFNRSAKESDKYEKTGIYTITVTNPTTDPYGNNPTIKKIYVGSDNIMIAAMNSKNAEYNVNQIAELVEQGAKIKPNGEIVMPETTPPPTETTTTTTTTTAATNSETSQTTQTATTTVTEPPITTTTATVSVSTETEAATEAMALIETEDNEKKVSPIPFILIGLISAAGIAFILWKVLNKS